MSSAEEFPLLQAIGLYAAHIRGDGNCLFNALSDQLHGDQTHHSQIRTRVIEHMRANAEYYKMFLEVYPGGGTRRNPKRKNAGTSASASFSPSAADVDRVFEEHVERMAKGGTWGDNMEIQAFASAFDTNVKIYQREFAYVIPAPGGESRPYTHIAYHTWEHYSSIRNIDGPHAGTPIVAPRLLDPQYQLQLQADIQNSPYTVPSWQLDALSNAYPTADPPSLRRALQESKGCIDDAYERLLAADEHKSVSSQQSSSAEREADNGEDLGLGPNKRQDRRFGRNSKLTSKVHNDRRERQIGLGMEKYKDSLETLVNANPTSARPSKPEISSSSSSNSDDGTWTPEPLPDGDTSSGSEYSPPPEVPGPKLTIKFTLPKKDTSLSQQPKVTKQSSSPKKHVTARDRKDIKKQAQKQAAKERKQAATGPKISQSSSFDSTASAGQPTIATSAMRTLYI